MKTRRSFSPEMYSIVLPTVQAWKSSGNHRLISAIQRLEVRGYLENVVLAGARCWDLSQNPKDSGLAEWSRQWKKTTRECRKLIDRLNEAAGLTAELQPAFALFPGANKHIEFLSQLPKTARYLQKFIDQKTTLNSREYVKVLLFGQQSAFPPPKRTLEPLRSLKMFLRQTKPGRVYPGFYEDVAVVYGEAICSIEEIDPETIRKLRTRS